MTIEREGGNVVFLCDDVHCQARHTEDSKDFAYTWMSAKRAGWESKRIGSGKKTEWVHSCPDCIL